MRKIKIFEQAIEGTLAADCGLFGFAADENEEIRTFAEYGQPFDGTEVPVVPKGGTRDNYPMMPITGWEAESVFIRNNEEGALAVAEACGFGHPVGITDWEEYYTRCGYNCRGEGTEPVLFCSSQTSGYRALASSSPWPLSHVDTLYTDGTYKFCHDVWRVDFKNADCCVIAVQSASSGSTVLAEYGWDEEYGKLGWRIHLISPVLEGGEVYQGRYAETFRKAIRGYYRRLHER